MPYIDLYPQSPELMARHTSLTLSAAPTFHDDVIVHDSTIGGWTELGPGTRISESTFGDYSYAAGDVQIIYTDVGKFCSIASHVRINPGNHPMWRVTQHHMTYRRKQYGFADEDDRDFFNWRREHRCVIGHDVWIGHGALVMPGVTVGHGAVIGGGAVVTRDVEPYAVVVGVPAKPVRYRFAPEIIEKLLAIGWWDWDRETLAARFADLNDIDTFIARYGGMPLS